ncbi:MAG: BNR-4 repeat-containing protein, partial [Candidatus Latescibacteria bacterium]|nr:BNR-4 repeat-containing protein [Candidatus Latescibacterota bacterium]
MDHTVLSTTGSTRGTAYGMSNKIVTHEGKTHVVWLDQIHKTYVATYDHEEKAWGDPVFVADGDDNHAGAAMTMDSKGYLYLAFGPHHNPMQHAVSAKPNDTSEWTMLPPFGGVNATYPSLVCDSHDVLHACYRGAYERERPWGVFYQKRKVDGDWTEPVKLVDPQGPSAYVHVENCVHVAGDMLYLSFHLVRSNEDNPGDTKGRGFGVMRSRDWGETWETISGEALELPVTPESACVIEYDDGIDIRMGNVVSFSGNRPFFTLNRREGEVDETFLYRWQKGKWETTSFLPLAEKLFGKCTMSDRCVLSISNDGIMYAAGVVCKRGGNWADPTNAIVLFTSRDEGETWRTYRISP